MNTRYRKILDAIFRTPTTASLAFSEIEALVLHLGGEVLERQGSVVKLVLVANSEMPSASSVQGSQAVSD